MRNLKPNSPDQTYNSPFPDFRGGGGIEGGGLRQGAASHSSPSPSLPPPPETLYSPDFQALYAFHKARLEAL